MPLKTYYELAKPGIIYGNLLTAVAGFFLASGRNINWWLLLAMALGLSLVIGGSCVFNNYLDQDIDGEMERTKDRALLSGAISPKSALVYASALLILGCLTLYFFTNLVTLLVALIGALSYVGVYTPLKRRTIYSSLIGSIPGATPPVIGYCAVTHTVNLEALLLFLILVLWQMPHFYGIALYRMKEYAKASIPLLPIKKGAQITKVHSMIYIFLFTLAAASLTYFGFTRYTYLAIVIILGLIWLYLGIKDFSTNTNDPRWGRRMFLFSLITITVFSVTLSLSAILP